MSDSSPPSGAFPPPPPPKDPRPHGPAEASTYFRAAIPMASSHSGSSVPEPSPSTKSIDERVATYTTVALTAVTGLAYVFGVWSVARFSEGIGVSPSDLGFEFRDYLLLAFLVLVPAVVGMLIAIAGMVLAVRVKDNRWRLAAAAGWVFIGLGSGVAAYFLSLDDYQSAIVFAVTIGAFVAGGELAFIDPSSSPSTSGNAITLVVIGVFSSLLIAYMVLSGTGYKLTVYGFDLQEWSTGELEADSSSPPMGLRLLVNPKMGIATVGNRSECVMRIRANVVSGASGAVVLKELDQFTPTNCELAQDPFHTSPPTTLTAAVVLGDITQEDIERFNAALASETIITPGSNFLSLAAVAAVNLCHAIPAALASHPATGDPSPEDALFAEMALGIFTSHAFEEFEGTDLARDLAVKTVVLEVAGRELCPEHQDAIREHLGRESP
jgi:hypothetical protein